MVARTSEIKVHENKGAAVTAGSKQILHFSDFPTPPTGMLRSTAGTIMTRGGEMPVEMLFSDGAITETFSLSPFGVTTGDQATRDDSFDLFPNLASTEPHLFPRPARQFLSRHRAIRALANNKTWVEH